MNPFFYILKIMDFLLNEKGKIDGYSGCGCFGENVGNVKIKKF